MALKITDQGYETTFRGQKITDEKLSNFIQKLIAKQASPTSQANEEMRTKYLPSQNLPQGHKSQVAPNGNKSESPSPHAKPVK